MIYLWIIKWIIFSIRDRRCRYAGAFLSRGWMGVAGLCRRFSRPVAHYRDAACLRVTTSLRRTTFWWGPFNGHRYVKRLHRSLHCSFNTIQKLFEYCGVLESLNIPSISDRWLIKKNMYFNRGISTYSRSKYCPGKSSSLAFNTIQYNWFSM